MRFDHRSEKLTPLKEKKQNDGKNCHSPRYNTQQPTFPCRTKKPQPSPDIPRRTTHNQHKLNRMETQKNNKQQTQKHLRRQRKRPSRLHHQVLPKRPPRRNSLHIRKPKHAETRPPLSTPPLRLAQKLSNLLGQRQKIRSLERAQPRLNHQRR